MHPARHVLFAAVSVAVLIVGYYLISQLPDGRLAQIWLSIGSVTASLLLLARIVSPHQSICGIWRSSFSWQRWLFLAFFVTMFLFMGMSDAGVALALVAVPIIIGGLLLLVAIAMRTVWPYKGKTDSNDGAPTSTV
jgi:hypothetical protein